MIIFFSQTFNVNRPFIDPLGRGRGSLCDELWWPDQDHNTLGLQKLNLELEFIVGFHPSLESAATIEISKSKTKQSVV